jgi:hypothetical protein
VRKFRANTMFNSVDIKTTGFKPPVSLTEGLDRTITCEFINQTTGNLFFTE